MTGPSQRAALDAVYAARPIVARLSMTRDKEDLAADIIEAWSAVEVGLRSLVGGTTLAGQALIRELRQRNFLSLDQANSLAEFNAARERAGRTDYAPTESDVNATREAFAKLESGLAGDAVTGRPLPAPSVVGAPVPVVATVPDLGTLQPTPRTRPAWVVPVLGIVAVVVLVLIGWFALAGRGPSSSAAYDQGVQAYKEGRREAAEASFRKAATDVPTDPMPHVYLARMEREAGNLGNANTEAVNAVRLGPTNATALRELASTLFAAQQYDDARKFYLRALTVDPNDKLSQGFLGCSLMRLGRVDEAQRWIGRAGPGSWSACSSPSAGVTGNPQVPMTGVPRP
ncbi:MAG: tetratricopeptide repeat protein [bacterium]